MQVHLNAAQVGQAQEGELSLNFIKKYIGYCRKYALIDKMQFFIILEFVSVSLLYSRQVLGCNVSILFPVANVVLGFLRKLPRCSRIVMFSCEVEHVIMKKMLRKKSTYLSLSGKA